MVSSNYTSIPITLPESDSRFESTTLKPSHHSQKDPNSNIAINTSVSWISPPLTSTNSPLSPTSPTSPTNPLLSSPSSFPFPSPSQNVSDSESYSSSLPLWKRSLQEAYLLSTLSIPAGLGAFLQFLNRLSTVIIVGHLPNSSSYLASSSLATLFINVFGFSLISGFTGALETLCSQAVGSNQKKLSGLLLQRGIIILLSICTLAAFFMFFVAESFLRVLG